MWTKTAVWSALVLTVATGAVAAQAPEPPSGGEWSVGAGRFNFGHPRPSGGVGLEYRVRSWIWRPRASARSAVVPAFGLIATSKDALFAYAGLRADFDVTQRWRLTPGFSIGAYDRSGDIDLGGPLEFRSSLDVSRAFGERTRMGLTLYHISNARLYNRNPGVNALAFVQVF